MTIAYTNASPRPVPRLASFVVKNASKIRASCVVNEVEEIRDRHDALAPWGRRYLRFAGGGSHDPEAGARAVFVSHSVLSDTSGRKLGLQFYGRVERSCETTPSS